MPDTPSPAAAPSGGQGRKSTFGFLTRKLGPAPVWVWAAIGLGALYWYTHYGPGAQSSQQATQQQGAAGTVLVVPGGRQVTWRRPWRRGREDWRSDEREENGDRDRRPPGVGPGQGAPLQPVARITQDQGHAVGVAGTAGTAGQPGGVLATYAGYGGEGQWKTATGWEAAAINYLTGEGVPPDQASTAIWAYQHGQPMSSRMQADAQLAVDGIGSPPKNPPPVTVQRAVPPRNTPRPKVRVIRAA